MVTIHLDRFSVFLVRFFGFDFFMNTARLAWACPKFFKESHFLRKKSLVEHRTISIYNE